MKKVVFVLLLLVVLLVGFCSTTKATSIDEVISGADKFLQEGQKNPEIVVLDKENAQEVMNFIYNTLLIIGGVVVLIVGTILGIKYMTSSVEGQAKIKETLIPFFIGAIVIFGSFGIWKLVVNILESV